MLRSLRNWFVSGLLLIAPVAVTVFVLNLLLKRIGAPASRLFFGHFSVDAETRIWLEYGLNVLALIAILTLITFLGRISQFFVGRWVIHTFERAIDNLPVVRTVYNTVKQIRDTFVQQQKAVFQQTVLIEYPRPSVWVLGFLTGTSRGEPQAKTESDLLNIFVPTTPNPTSGFLLMVPREQVIFLEMSVGEGMKLIISGGAVAPPWPTPPRPAKLENGAPAPASASENSPTSPPTPPPVTVEASALPTPPVMPPPPENPPR